MTKMKPRVAIFGFHLEANNFCPQTVKEDCLKSCWEEGEQISRLARELNNLPSEISSFYERMDQHGEWVPVPLIVVTMPPGGPASADLWAEYLGLLEQHLRTALPLDAVYACNHGASSADGEADTEGAMLSLVRRVVGPDVPMIATHDLHCNVSERTVEALDALIAYRTNPHIDQRERAAEAADLLHEMFSGMKPEKAFIRLPITPPTVTLLTDKGPYADLIRMAAAQMHKPGEGPIANVSVAGGFVFSDLPTCGMTVTVTARGDRMAARRCALQLARAAWAGRGRYVLDVINVGRAVDLALGSSQALLFADVADNPGGGGRGNTSWILSAFDQARVPNVVLGVFIDPELAEHAHALGVGAEFEAVFNRTESEYARRYTARARILCLCDGEQLGRRGLYRDKKFSLGASALIELAGSGMRVVVGSLRRQLADPVMLEMHGIDIATVGCLVVKSRGHYRAGFDEFFSDDRIHDVDSPGLTTPNLKQLTFKGLPRPVWPIDEDVVWLEPDWALECESSPIPVSSGSITENSVCAACGKGFSCGVQAGGKTCWCMELPVGLPILEGATEGCYCPACLAEKSMEFRRSNAQAT